MGAGGRQIEVGAVRRDPIWIVEARAGAGAIGAPGSPRPGQRRHHSRGNHDLANFFVPGLPHIEVGAVRRELGWTIQPCVGAGAISAAGSSRHAHHRRHLPAGNHDLADRVLAVVCDIEIGAVRRDPVGIVEPRVGSGAIGGSGSSRRSRKGRHHPAGDHDLADRVVSSIGNVEIGAVGGDIVWVVKFRGGTRAVHAAGTPRHSRQRGHDPAGNHDLADRVVAVVRHIEVRAVGGETPRSIEPRRRARAVRAAGNP